MKKEIIMIAAVGKNNELGKKGDLIWKIPGDLKRFKEITEGHPIVMGYKTYESLGLTPLPNRMNIVMALDEDVSGDVRVARSVEEAVQIAENSPGSEKIFIIGGGQIYKIFLDRCDVLDLTMVNATEEDADTFFPEYDMTDFEEVLREEKSTESFDYAYVELRRK